MGSCRWCAVDRKAEITTKKYWSWDRAFAIVPLDGRFKITKAPRRARRKTNGNR